MTIRLILLATMAIPAIAQAQQIQVKTASVPQIFVLDVPTVPQGQTLYSSSYPTINPVDVDRLAIQALQLQQAATSAQRTYHSETLDFVARLVELQQPVAQSLARGQAAAKVLREVGLGQPTEGSGTDAAASSPTPRSSLIQQTCGKCHVGSEAEGGFRLDQTFDAAKAISQIAAQKMPPSDKLSNDQRLALITEFLSRAKEN